MPRRETGCPAMLLICGGGASVAMATKILLDVAAVGVVVAGARVVLAVVKSLIVEVSITLELKGADEGRPVVSSDVITV